VSTQLTSIQAPRGDNALSGSSRAKPHCWACWDWASYYRNPIYSCVFLVFEREAGLLGDDDADWDDVHSALDTSKYSHLTEEEVQIAATRIEPPSEEISTVEGILSFLNHHSLLFLAS